ncbi:TPA: helix-turn-helix domain-containing protein [Streptococcus agalactiae]
MLPEKLKTLRTEAGLTQKELAKIIQTSQQNIAYWEKGSRNPKHKSIEKLANVFNVSTDYLLGNTDLKNPNDLDIEKVKQNLKKSLGYNGTSDIPEDELESMAQAFIEHFKNQ